MQLLRPAERDNHGLRQYKYCYVCVPLLVSLNVVLLSNSRSWLTENTGIDFYFLNVELQHLYAEYHSEVNSSSRSYIYNMFMNIVYSFFHVHYLLYTRLVWMTQSGPSYCLLFYQHLNSYQLLGETENPLNGCALQYEV